MKTALILGAGPAGCAAAHQIRLQLPDWKVILIEKAPLVGAGARTMIYAGHPYTFGPRHFLTKKQHIWDYMDKYCPLRSCADHEFKTFIPSDSEFFNFPIHIDDIDKMKDSEQIKVELDFIKNNPPEKPNNLQEFWIDTIGPSLYKKFIGPYNKKMWQTDPANLDTFTWSHKGSMIKTGDRKAWDGTLSGYPKALDGYNKWFDICVEGCEVQLRREIGRDIMRNNVTGQLRLDSGGILYEPIDADIIINTLSLDDLFGHKFGSLPYIGRDFYKFILPIEFALPEHVYFTYEGGMEPWTRITEYKKFTGFQSPYTLLSLEIPSSNGRHYPMPTKAAQARAREYIDLMPKNMYTIGRHGTYRYAVDITACIEMAMAVVDHIKNGWDHPVPTEAHR